MKQFVSVCLPDGSVTSKSGLGCVWPWPITLSKPCSGFSTYTGFVSTFGRPRATCVNTYKQCWIKAETKNTPQVPWFRVKSLCCLTTPGLRMLWYYERQHTLSKLDNHQIRHQPGDGHKGLCRYLFVTIFVWMGHLSTNKHIVNCMAKCLQNKIKFWKRWAWF